MAIMPRVAIDRALHLLREGLAPFLKAQLDRALGDNRLDMSVARELVNRPSSEWDVAVMLRVMKAGWADLSGNLDRSARSYVFEAAEVRNAWAHQVAFSHDAADRGLDTIARLLQAIGAPQAESVASLRDRAGLGRSQRLTPHLQIDTMAVQAAPLHPQPSPSAASRIGPRLPNTAAFREEVAKRMAIAAQEDRAFLDLNSGELHRDLGGGGGKDGRLVSCCNALHEAVGPRDEILESPPKGRGTRLTIRYHFPR